MLLTITQGHVSPYHCEGLDHLPTGTLPTPTGPLLSSLLILSLFCKGPALPQKSTVSPISWVVLGQSYPQLGFSLVSGSI